ncbi:MazG-like family protein [Streptomyces odonnellii]|uniref:MazG-like family protein n=1 Tax=Streptomyces odonnellii TaxID=1417980 RepID=UPI000626BDBC|nr:MazG-like family protein [Streptomyces odonnellii]
MDHSSWTTVERLTRWLDHSAEDLGLPPDTVRLLRVLKVTEENGEVAEAIHGAAFGSTHTWDDVEKELCGVIFTGMVALVGLTSDAPTVFENHLAHIAQRSLTTV